MATTIKLKNGSGAPLAGDLVQGEPALDLTNKRLYTEDSGGTVIEVGTNPSTLTVDTTTLVVDAANNKVGVGTASPDGKLNVFSASAGSVSADADADELVLENSGNVGLSLLTASTGESGIYFGNPGTNGQKDFYLKYYHESHATAGNRRAFTFNTSSTERMRIDSSGRVGIGTTSPSNMLHISSSDPTIRLQDTDATGYCLINAASNSRIQIKADEGNNDANTTIEFHVDGSERMRIDSSGNVGIGTNTPSSYNSIMDDLVIAGSGDSGITIASGTTSEGSIAFADGTSGADTYRGWINYNHNSNFLRFATDATERMRIDSSGNVGIGTTSPTTPLAVHSDAGTVIKIDGDTSNTSRTLFFRSVGTGEGIVKSDGNMHFLQEDSSRYMRFSTANTERMRIDSSGNVLVGTTSATVGASSGTLVVGFAGNAANGIKVYDSYSSSATNNAVVFIRGSSEVGTITTTTTTTAYNTSSDERLKENIVDAPAGNIDAIRVRSFDWKVDGSHQTYGMVAQELVAVAPEAVSQGKTDDGMWAVDYSKLVPMMIKEIQDLKAEVAALKGA